MKRLMIAISLAGMLPVLAVACGMGEQTPEGYENATVQHVYQHWQQGASSPIPFVILDVRTVEEYKQGHIKGAKLIPVQVLASQLASVPKDRQVYVYCHSGVRSAKAASVLVGHGFTRVENMIGGIEAWKQAGYPVVK